MENENQVSVEAPVVVAQKGKVWKIIGIVLIAIVLIFIILVVVGLNSKKTDQVSVLQESQDEDQKLSQNIKSENNMNKLIFNKEEFVVGFKLPATNGVDYNSESYEWVTGSETVENWKKLITTHKLAPANPTVPLSAEAYAQNAVDLETKKGAVMLETSVINTQDAKDSGVDVSNPPYLLVYLFKNSDLTKPSELNIQKIQNSQGGGINLMIYAERILIKSDEDLNTYLASSVYVKNRQELILSKFPW